RQRGNAVKKHRQSQPEQSHGSHLSVYSACILPAASLPLLPVTMDRCQPPDGLCSSSLSHLWFDRPSDSARRWSQSHCLLSSSQSRSRPRSQFCSPSPSQPSSSRRTGGTSICAAASG